MYCFCVTCQFANFVSIKQITYACPDGFVFETPQLLAEGIEQSIMAMTCAAFATWDPPVIPKCIRKKQEYLIAHIRLI